MCGACVRLLARSLSPSSRSTPSCLLSRSWRRLSTTCLVCRRWHELSHSAPLLSRVAALLPRFGADYELPTQAAAWAAWGSFGAWMRRHGAKVGSLHLSLNMFEPRLSAADQRRLAQLIWRCLESCQAPGSRLQELSLTLPPGPVALPASLPLLLRKLNVGSVGGALAPLSGLEGLRRWG